MAVLLLLLLLLPPVLLFFCRLGVAIRATAGLGDLERSPTPRPAAMLPSSAASLIMPRAFGLSIPPCTLLVISDRFLFRPLSNEPDRADDDRIKGLFFFEEGEEKRLKKTRREGMKEEPVKLYTRSRSTQHNNEERGKRDVVERGREIGERGRGTKR